MRTVVRLVLGVFLWCAGAARAADRPNVLLICVDDLKPMLGCYGDTTIQSPNVDRLAARGLLFERAFCNQAVCSPSRNALLTGLRPQSLGIYDLATNFREAEPEAVTLPQHFKANGYRTEALGKIFHVGHGNHEDPASWSVPHWRPNGQGYALPENRPKGASPQQKKGRAAAKKAAQDLPRGAAYESADVPDDAYPDGKVADEAVLRLRAAKRRTDTPFFLAVGFVKPHLPFCAPKKYWDMYDRDAIELPAVREAPAGAPAYAPQAGGELRQYAGIPKQGPLADDLQRALIHGYHAATSYTDAQVGRVLGELDALGLTDQTVVVLWGDHGWHLGDHGIWCKHTNYEQAARIPLIVAAPGVTRAGTRTGAMVESVDVYPTLSELAGLPAPASSRALDGRSLVPLLKGPDAPWSEAVFHVYPRNAPGVGPVMGRAVRTARHRLVEWKKVGAPPETAEIELYNYESDPAETKNLAGDQPEVVSKLRAILNTQPEARIRAPRAD